MHFECHGLVSEPFDVTSWLLILMLCIHVVALCVYAFEWFSPSGLDKGNNAKGRSPEVTSPTAGCFGRRCCPVTFLFHFCFIFKASADAVSINMLPFSDRRNDFALFIICVLDLSCILETQVGSNKHTSVLRASIYISKVFMNKCSFSSKNVKYIGYRLCQMIYFKFLWQ